MEAVNPTILKTTIEAIPVLTEDNFSSWKTRISALFKLGGVKDQILAGEPALEENDNSILCAILLAKISQSTHNNVVTSVNEDDAILLWKSIIKRFMSSEPSNQARVYNQFANISFDSSNIEKFITKVRASLSKMEDVGVILPDDILTYKLLRRLPSSLDNIKQSITHSRNGEDIKPKTLIEHLEIHLNKQKVASSGTSESIGTTMFTKEDPCFRPGAHNPHAITHTKENCWMIYPEKRAAHYEKKNKENNVRIFSSFSLSHPELFVLPHGL
jgi:hypothetical protein